MRLFIAVRLSRPVLEQLVLAQKALRRQGAAGNFSREENLHLTLAFLGETENTAGAMAAMRRAAGGGAISLTVSGSGRFGSLWWAGSGENPRLSELAETLSRELCRRGFAMEKRAFRPHITLARQVTCPRPIRLEIPPRTMTVRSLSLMKSERAAGKLVYTELGRVPL